MNVRKILLLSLMAMLSLQACTQSTFDKYFEDKSLRIDFMSMGDAQSQTAVVHELREEPVWGGPKKNLVEPFGYGEYLMEVYDAAGGELIYSRSFCSLFGEWRTTAEAKVEKQAWYNSMSIPFPKNRIVVDLKARNKADMKFYSIMRHEIDPQSMFIDKSALVDNKVVKLQDNGGPTDKVDLVFIAEGYTEAEMDKFFKDAQRFSDALFACPPFDTCRDEFNVWAVGTVSMATKTHKADVSRTVRLGIVSIAAFAVISGSLSSTAISVTEASVLTKDVAFFMEMASLSESEKAMLDDYRNMELNEFAEYIDGEIDALADIPPTRLDMIRAQDKEILKAGFGASGLGNVAEAFMLIPICHVIAVAAAGLFLMFSAYTFATGKGSQRLYFILRIVTFAASLITFTIIALFFFSTLIKISVALGSIGSERMYLVIMNGGPLLMLIFSIVMFAIPTRPTRPKKRRTYPVYAYPQMPYPYPAQVPPQSIPPTEQDKQNDT